LTSSELPDNTTDEVDGRSLKSDSEDFLGDVGAIDCAWKDGGADDAGGGAGPNKRVRSGGDWENCEDETEIFAVCG